MEKTYCQKLDSVVREVNLVRAKLGDREDQLQAAKDCLTVKVSGGIVLYGADPLENCHFSVKKLSKTCHFVQKNCQK